MVEFSGHGSYSENKGRGAGSELLYDVPISGKVAFWYYFVPFLAVMWFF